MIDIQTTYEEIITELGQDAYVEADVFELDLVKCLRMVRQCLGIYNRYSPHSGYQWVTIESQNYDFRPEEAPAWISSVTPTADNVVTIGSLFGGGLAKFPGMGSTPFIWQYRSPTLYCQYDGEVEVKGVFNHAITTTATSDVVFSSVAAGSTLTVAGLTYTANATTETTTAQELATAFAMGIANENLGSGSLAITDLAVVAEWSRVLTNNTHVVYTSTTSTTPVKIGVTVSLAYTIATMDDTDYLFFELLKARMLKSLGRNRRAFTLNDLPITSDASELVSEGQTLEEATMAQMQEQSKAYLAWS